jgi:uncharacterized protein
MSAKKRFIAGAVCPRCQAMDTIVKYREGDADFRECAVCGFVDEAKFQPQLRELQTRVNTSVETVVEETQAVRILTPQND